jgi:hypothetical protein
VTLERDGETFTLDHGQVVIAAITSCTNTSNPTVMVAAGLLAEKAVRLGLSVRPWVKTSLAPGSQVVIDYYRAAGLLEPLERLGFNLFGLVAPPASATPVRCLPTWPRPSPTVAWLSPPCSPATATSRGASIPMSA